MESVLILGGCTEAIRAVTVTCPHLQFNVYSNYQLQFG